jgi:hypothetical protein
MFHEDRAGRLHGPVNNHAGPCHPDGEHLAQDLCMKRLMCLALIVTSHVACATMDPPKGEDAWRQVEGTPVLWRDPGAIASRDLFWGTGSADRAPKAPFTFLSEDAGGTNPKIKVRDANEVEWSVKFSGTEAYKNEVHAEVAATRLVWALGYLAEENYFVDSGKIDKLGTLKRAASVVGADGSFQRARFERKDPSMQYTEHTWSFEANPFVGTRELSGLLILTAALHHWDLKHDNTAIVQVRRQDRLEVLYLFSDLGSTFGKMEGLPRVVSGRDRWNLEAYRAEPLVDAVRDGKVHLNHDGTASVEPVPLEHARWFATLAAQLTPDQVRRAFEAAGASADERDGFSARFLEKIRELQQAVGSAMTPMI